MINFWEMKNYHSEPNIFLSFVVPNLTAGNLGTWKYLFCIFWNSYMYFYYFFNLIWFWCKIILIPYLSLKDTNSQNSIILCFVKVLSREQQSGINGINYLQLRIKNILKVKHYGSLSLTLKFSLLVSYAIKHLISFANV